MYKKHIGITMPHSTNKYVVSFMTVTLMSCTHIDHVVYDEDQVPKNSDKAVYFEEYSAMDPKEEKYEEIYCTPEDEKNGVKITKITIDALRIPCGRSKIQPMENRTLEIERIFLGVEQSPRVDILLGHHLLLLKDGDKVLQKMQVEKKMIPFGKKSFLLKLEKMLIGRT